MKIKNTMMMALLMAVAIGGWALEPPKMQCLKLMNNNQRMKMAWSNSEDCASFKTFYFYINNILCDSLSCSQGFNFCNYGSKDINNVPVADDYYCYIMAVDSNNNAYYSDTIHSISITVTAISNNTMARLEWEAPTSVLDDTWGSTYGIYKKRDFESDFPTTPFASVPNTQNTYIDTSDVCDNIISYQVGITNYYGTTGERCPFMTTIGSARLVDSISPTAPILDSVTVTSNNRVMLGFHGTEPYMMSYIIYYINPNGTIPFDTVYNQTFWIDPVMDPSADSRYYRIATMDSCGNVSPLTNNQQCNMMLHLKSTDACRKSATIQWSTYPNLINGILRFDILLSTDNGQNWSVAGSTTENSFTIGDLEFNQHYIAYVRVVNNGATVTASSNRINIEIQAEEASDFSYLSSVSVIENHHIQIKVLTSGDTLPFETITLQRSEDGITFENFITIPYTTNTSNYVFYDSLADFNRHLYYYRTFLVNKCGAKVAYSNISHNILLLGENNAQNNVLSWRGYENWDGDVDRYFVLRKVESEDLFNNIGDVTPSVMNTYSDDIASMYESGSKFSYYIEAQELPNRYGFEETSNSNYITVIQPPTLYIPNAFRPLGSANKVFKPINSFVSMDGYRFSIFTRKGECIFMTNNPQEGWDGRIDGVLVPMDVYVYYLEYKMPDGTMMERTGTVTLVK